MQTNMKTSNQTNIIRSNEGWMILINDNIINLIDQTEWFNNHTLPSLVIISNIMY